MTKCSFQVYQKLQEIWIIFCVWCDLATTTATSVSQMLSGSHWGAGKSNVFGCSLQWEPRLNTPIQSSNEFGLHQSAHSHLHEPFLPQLFEAINSARDDQTANRSQKFILKTCHLIVMTIWLYYESVDFECVCVCVSSVLISLGAKKRYNISTQLQRNSAHSVDVSRDGMRWDGSPHGETFSKCSFIFVWINYVDTSNGRERKGTLAPSWLKHISSDGTGKFNWRTFCRRSSSVGQKGKMLNGHSAES